MAKPAKAPKKTRDTPLFSEVVRLAIPNKGRIAAPIMDLVEKSGLHLAGDRRTAPDHQDARPPCRDPLCPAGGYPGVRGHGSSRSRHHRPRHGRSSGKSDVEELLDLQFGKAKLVLAVHEDSGITSVKQLEGKKIATEFPVITRTYFAKHKVKVEVVLVGGACEATPQLGIADAIIDLSSSGTTLKTNRLRVIDEVLATSTHLIANHESLKTKKDKIDEIHLALESVIRARGQCYLMMNVKRTSLETVKRVLPGLSGPTVMDVASSEDLVAVHAVVNEERVYSLINALKRAGAKDILVMAIQRMIR